MPLYNYTLMPTHMRGRFSPEELKDAELAPPFSFTKGCPVLRVPGRAWAAAHPFGNLLFDVQADPKQLNPLQDEAIEAMMTEKMVSLMQANDSPVDQYERLGLPIPLI